MGAVEEFLTGEMDSRTFIHMVQTDAELQETIRRLIPDEAKDNPEHPLWKSVSYSVHKPLNYDYLRHIRSICRFDHTIGDTLNLFGTLQCVYRYLEPDLLFTTVYDDNFDVYLSAIQDCFDGPEVEETVERIIQDAVASGKSRTKRTAQAKEDVREAFHVTDRKRPRWIQGPEWPMGEDSPMQFVEQKRKGEEVRYTFRDVTTGELRTVAQWY